jgi:hypothetical protein
MRIWILCVCVCVVVGFMYVYACAGPYLCTRARACVAYVCGRAYVYVVVYLWPVLRSHGRVGKSAHSHTDAQNGPLFRFTLGSASASSLRSIDRSTDRDRLTSCARSDSSVSFVPSGTAINPSLVFPRLERSDDFLEDRSPTLLLYSFGFHPFRFSLARDICQASTTTLASISIALV